VFVEFVWVIVVRVVVVRMVVRVVVRMVVVRMIVLVVAVVCIEDVDSHSLVALVSVVGDTPVVDSAVAKRQDSL